MVFEKMVLEVYLYRREKKLLENEKQWSNETIHNLT